MLQLHEISGSICGDLPAYFEGKSKHIFIVEPKFHGPLRYSSAQAGVHQIQLVQGIVIGGCLGDKMDGRIFTNCSNVGLTSFERGQPTWQYVIRAYMVSTKSKMGMEWNI